MMPAERSGASSLDVDDLADEILQALSTEHGHGDGRKFDGRAIAVKVSPDRGSSTHIVVGTAALPPAYRTPPHQHDAEEIALCLAGTGGVEIDGTTFPMAQGTLVVTPPGSEHTTFADADQPLVVLWFYAPPGSENRWLTQDAAMSVSDGQR